MICSINGSSLRQFNKRNEEVCGYTKKGKESSWLYSEKVVEVIGEYMTNFPDLFNYLAKNENSSRDMFQVESVFDDREVGVATLTAMANW